METRTIPPGEVTKACEAVGEKAEKPSKVVRLDFSKQKGEGGSPFLKAESLQKRLKIFLWGDTGAGKTTTALQFPKPAVIDIEGGTELYGESFEFGVLRTTGPDDVMAAVDWLASSEHPYRTLVIDPVTVYWDALQKKWSDIFLRRNRGSKGYRFEYYDLQPKDWLSIKAEFKELVRKLIALDMNVIVVARAKTRYKDGAFMQAVGETFDGEKSLPYMFDIVLRMYLDEKGRHMAVALKDRSNRLPKGDFEVSYAVFEDVFGKKALTRKAKPVAEAAPAPPAEPVVPAKEATAEPPADLATPEQKEAIRRLCSELGFSEEKVAKSLATHGARSLDDLPAAKAAAIITKLEAAAAGGGAAKDEKTGS